MSASALHWICVENMKKVALFSFFINSIICNTEGRSQHPNPTLQKLLLNLNRYVATRTSILRYHCCHPNCCHPYYHCGLVSSRESCYNGVSLRHPPEGACNVCKLMQRVSRPLRSVNDHRRRSHGASRLVLPHCRQLSIPSRHCSRGDGHGRCLPLHAELHSRRCTGK